MQAISVLTGATPTKLADAGPRRYIHVLNNSSTTIYIGYDGNAANVTAANGFPLLPNAVLTLENSGQKDLFTDAVYAVHSDGANQEVRVAGV